MEAVATRPPYRAREKGMPVVGCYPSDPLSLFSLSSRLIVMLSTSPIKLNTNSSFLLGFTPTTAAGENGLAGQGREGGRVGGKV